MSSAVTPAQQRPSFTTKEGRSFYQERVALAGKIMGLLSSGFLIVGNAVGLAFVPSYSLGAALTRPTNLWHAVASLVLIGVWLVARRGSRSVGVLKWLDAGSTTVAMTAYSLMVFGTDPDERLHHIVLLVGMIIQLGRAIIIPSTARFTLLVGVVAAVPPIVLSAYLGQQWGIIHRATMPTYDMPVGLFVAIDAALWSAATIIMATLASRLIFGLRKQVREAMRLGQYTLVSKIGEGGMGSVYVAQHALLRRATAIKLLPPERAGVKNLARFEREVQMTSQLTHPNTIAVFDYGKTPDGVFYYAMEYLDGVDLQQLVDLTGPQAPSRVVHIATQICGALAEAHEIGLVHRDIKPANVLLCERGRVPDVAKVVDFGLVKELESPVSEESLGVTSDHAVLGTPLYISPEAIRAPADVDARSDIYSLGAVLYCLLTSAAPFSGTSVYEVCGKHLHVEPQPPSEKLGRALPADLENLVVRCLAKEPSARPQSMGELREALESCDVPRWGIKDAQAWWQLHPEARTPARKHADPDSPAYAKTITVARSR